MGFVGKLELLAKKHGKRIKDLIVVLWCGACELLGLKIRE